ncbi:MAG: hypothetical protein Q7S69_08110 [Nitrosomonadaceae bacterium]|nr:hypothetical protein [Nitrosomonadaceae bacterium]
MAELLTPKQKSAIERAKRSPDLQGFLFRKATGVQWFNAFKEAGFLLPTEIPQPIPAKEEGYVSIPVWPITDYLVAASEQLLEPNNELYAIEFLNFIRSATMHAKERGFGNYRVWWQFSKIIRHIPPHLISANDLLLIDYWLDDKYERGLVAESLGEHWLISLLDRNDEHCRSLSIGLLQSLYRVRFLDSRYGESNRKEARLHFDSWHARNLTKKVAGRAGKVLGQSAVEVFRNQLEHIIVTLSNDKWSSLWRSAVEDHEQNHAADDAEDILVESLRDALLAYVGEDPAAAKAFVGELLESPFETTRRIAIYTVDQRYQQLNELIGRVIIKQHFTSNFRHEMWHLLHNHYPEFSIQEKVLVQGAIAGLVVQDDNAQQREGATAYQRAIWLSAIKDYGDDEGQLYRECIKIIGGEPEHPDFSSYMSSGWVDHKSPFPKEELLSLDVADLVKKLNAYRETYKPPQGFDEPDLEGLVKMLRQVVKAEPLCFYSQLYKFSESDLSFVYELIEAYRELWSENAQLPWDEIWGSLLGFCLDLANQDRFWSPENAKEGRSFVASRSWIVGGIGRLIEAGTKSDEHAFSEKLLNQAEEVILILLKKGKGEEFKNDNDAVMVAINSPRGHCIEALINLTLRSCRLANKQCGNHAAIWTHFQPIYDAELARAEIGEYEFVTLVVNYLPNFFYMSKEWVVANLDNIFDKGNYQKWLCAMNGYAYVSTVYEGIYRHLKDNGHLIRALDDENIKEKVYEKIIQNIAVAYINGFEKLENESSLVHQLLVRRKYQELSQLIWFFWSQRKDGDENIRAKIFELWPRLLEVIDTSSREGKKLASKLCDWSVFVDVVNEGNKQLLLTIAPFAEEEYNSHDLLESIAKISVNQPNEAYEIWLELLKGTSRDFPEEAVRAGLANLVRVGPEGVRMAKDIVSKYIRGGNERPSQWLREINAGAAP